MPDWLSSALVYLFQTPGSRFSYYLPVVAGAVAALLVPFYHYALAARLRFRRFPAHLAFLDRAAAWTAGLAAAWLLIALVRYWNAPVLAWRIWLYALLVVTLVVYVGGIVWLYGRGPRLLEDYEMELQRKRYLAGATPAVPSLARRGRRPAKQR